MKQWLRKIQELSHVNLIRELQDIPEDWKNYLRMNQETYLDLLERNTPLIKKKDTVMRSAITPHQLLASTLWFLITGGSESLVELSFFYFVCFLYVRGCRPGHFWLAQIYIDLIQDGLQKKNQQEGKKEIRF